LTHAKSPIRTQDAAPFQQSQTVKEPQAAPQQAQQPQQSQLQTPQSPSGATQRNSQTNLKVNRPAEWKPELIGNSKSEKQLMMEQLGLAPTAHDSNTAFNEDDDDAIGYESSNAGM